MAEQLWNIVYEGGSGEIVEKKSRFIANVFPIKTEEEALERIEALKKKYWDARHNCYAYILGNNEVLRYSDDGEPGGTAGKPILDILLSENLRNCLVVVTRYFGGTLLGTGGLVRAYQQSTKEGLANSVIAACEKGWMIELSTDYNGIGKIQYIVGTDSEFLFLIDTGYTDVVTMKILAHHTKTDAFLKKVTEATNGRCTIKKGDCRDYIVVHGKPIFTEQL